MLSFAFLGSRARFVAVLAAAGACVAAAVASFAACLTAPPPDVGASTDERPQIYLAAVQPPPWPALTEDTWPSDDHFLVPVFLPDPNAPCAWRVFDKVIESNSPAVEKGEQLTCLTSVDDGGVVVQDVTISKPTDGFCHLFTFIVANGFSAGMVPDSIGGDTVSWEYAPSNALCNFYDAGSFQDGAFPPEDAGMDGLPVTPESGPAPDSGADP